MTDQILRVMPREMRMMSERIFSLTDLPKGFALMVGDVVMYSEAMDLGGFKMLLNRLDAVLTTDPSKLRFKQDPAGALVLDGGGVHAWFVVPSVLDLLAEALVGSATATVEVINVMDAAEIGIATGLGCRAGLEVTFDGSRISATRTEPADPVLDRIMAKGCPIAADLWWEVWAKAQTALTPDSAVSRRHAGVNIVAEDGQIIGRTDNDDDTDVSFIAAPEAVSSENSNQKSEDLKQ